MFDVDGEGYVTTEQLRDGMSKFLDFVPNSQDLNSFMKIFDKNQDGLLKHAEFCDAFLPIDAILASQLAHKPP